MKALIKLLRSLETSSPLRPAKTGGGVLLYNPKPYDLSEIKRLAEAEGLSVITTTQPQVYKDKVQDPHIFVGAVKSYTDDDLCDVLSSVQ